MKLKRLLGFREEERAIEWSDVWGDASPPRTASGEVVTWDSSLTISTVFACMRIITDNVSTLTIDSFTRDNDNAPVPYRPKPKLLEFSTGLRRIPLVGQMVMSLLFDGNSFSVIGRNEGEPIFLVPLDPRQVEIEGDVMNPVYRIGPERRVATADEVLHIPGLMLPGELRGLSPIKYAAETAGLSLATQRHGASFMKNAAIPPAVVELPVGVKVTKEGLALAKASWNEAHRGAGNSGKIAFLTEGAKLTKLQFSPEEAQLLQTRQFQIADIARWYGVPPHLLADASGSTSWGSGLAEQNTALAQLTLRPWVERIEEGLTGVIRSSGREGVFIKMNLERLMRGDLQDRVSAYQVGLDAGFYTVDEVRAWEDLPAIQSTDDGMSLPQLVRALQQIYLSVGTVISADEAREILNRGGAGLGPLPELSGKPPARSPVQSEDEEE